MIVLLHVLVRQVLVYCNSGQLDGMQVRFEQPICLTGIKVGAAPGSGPGAAVTPHIHLFAYDLSTLGAARFAILTENCSLPTSGTKAVRIEVRCAWAYLQHIPYSAPSTMRLREGKQQKSTQQNGI